MDIRKYPSALEKAVAMLAARPCSRYEIQRRLRLHHYDPDVIDLVLQKLDREKLLDDQDFSVQWACSRKSKYGVNRLRQELRMKGVEEEDIDTALAAISPDEELEQAMILARKKISTASPEEDQIKRRNRIVSFLVRRGYSFEIARKAYQSVCDSVCQED